jgi:hypothetical protein
VIDHCIQISFPPLAKRQTLPYLNHSNLMDASNPLTSLAELSLGNNPTWKPVPPASQKRKSENINQPISLKPEQTQSIGLSQLAALSSGAPSLTALMGAHGGKAQKTPKNSLSLAELLSGKGPITSTLPNKRIQSPVKLSHDTITSNAKVTVKPDPVERVQEPSKLLKFLSAQSFPTYSKHLYPNFLTTFIEEGSYQFSDPSPDDIVIAARNAPKGKARK